jgi:hypothetical protein
VKATRATLLLALPEPVERAVILEGSEEWRDPVRDFGVELVEDRTADVVVAPARASEQVLRRNPRTALLVGRCDLAPWRKAGYAVERHLPVPSLERPALLVPLDRAHAARYALSRLSLPSGRVKAVRNRALGLAITGGLPVPGELAIAHRGNPLPFAVRAAQGLGLPAELDSLFVPGRSVERPAFLIFERGRRTPGWIAKLSYLDRSSPPSDGARLQLVAELGGRLAAHAPRSLGSCVVGGWPMSVETAATGSQLVYKLRSAAGRRRRQALVESVAEWLVAIAVETLAPNSLDERLSEVVAPSTLSARLAHTELTTSLAGLPATIEHSDLGPEHVIVQGDRFTVIDWEGARRHGLPLADLAFFLTRALPILDGEADDPAYTSRQVFARLLSGQSRSATVLARWLAAGQEACGIPTSSIGSLLSVVWLDHYIEGRRHYAETWFTDPDLGPMWTPS